MLDSIDRYWTTTLAASGRKARQVSYYKEGKVQPGDVEEAIDTALAVGDFDYSNASHHGTPQERRDAWLLGYHQGDPRRCREMIPV